MPPLVSVVIPVYNVLPYLGECIESVIKQTYHNLEIINIDDGSTDGSQEICEKYQIQDKRIGVVHQTNQGLSAARNTGLDYMHGDIVAFIDSDDAFLPNAIDEMVRAMNETGADIVMCGFYCCKTTKHMFPSQSRKEFKVHHDLISSTKALKYIIDGKINVNVWNKVYRKELFDYVC